MSLATPVGFLIFNRPDLTEQVFAAIAQAQPKRLFVIADGPRPGRVGEAERCEQARSIIQKIDWDCELLTNFSEINLGCGRREATGFDWVFSHVEEAIFLEDDTLPHPSFFSFCEALLDRYRDDERIMHINGDNSVNQNHAHYSYYYSKYMHGWGWASWRRAWQYYDYAMKQWPQFKESGLLELICTDPYELTYWVSIFDQMHKDPQVLDTWDYQWMFAIWSQRGLVIEPNENLISNLGFNRDDAAHTKSQSFRSKLPMGDLSDLRHPLFMVEDRNADRNTFDYVFGGAKIRQQNTFKFRMRKKLSSLKKTALIVCAASTRGSLKHAGVK